MAVRICNLYQVSQHLKYPPPKKNKQTQINHLEGL